MELLKKTGDNLTDARPIKPVKRIKTDACLINDGVIAAFLKENWNTGLSTHESIYLVCTDEWQQVKSYCCISANGNTNSCFFDLNNVLSIALKNKATRIIIAHNHPTGSEKPSCQDVKVTKDLQLRCKCVGIELFDHIILSPSNRYFSFKKEGLLSNMESENNRLFNVTNPSTLEYKILQLVDLSFKERLSGSNTIFIDDVFKKTLDRLYVKYYDPIDLKVNELAAIKTYK